MRSPRVWSLALPFVVAACATPTDITHERQIGTIRFYGDPVQVQLPDTVQRGETFTVEVTTYGGGCIRQGETEVRVDALTAVVTPYDFHPARLPPGTVCTADLALYRHTAEVRFQRSGTATVRIRGREEPSGEVLTLDRTVVVR